MEAKSVTKASESEGLRPTLLDGIARDPFQFISAVRDARLYHLDHVKFSIIDGCNIRCEMCNHWRREGYKRNALTTGRLLLLAEELANLETQIVSFSGGEPTLRRDLPQIVRKLCELGIKAMVTTNGTRLTKDYATALRAGGVNKVNISIESAKPEIHDRVVGFDGAWHKIVAGIHFLTDGDEPAPMLEFRTVITSTNAGPGLVGLVPLAQSLGVTRMQLSPVYVNHLSLEERTKLVPSTAQTDEFRTRYLPEMLRLGEELGVSIAIDGEDEGPKVPRPVDLVRIENLSSRQHILGYYQNLDRTCYLPFYHCTINYNGDVLACCRMTEGPGAEAGVFGNIQDKPLVEILDSSEAGQFRRRLQTVDVPQPCANCAMQILPNRMIDKILERVDAESFRSLI
jgi:radical SAM protein with 4Fe4S-binding SPASM domain